ncbi:13944_t:CDS:2, partial [Gigaspora margarita]
MGNTKSTKIVIKSNLFQPAPQNYRPRIDNIQQEQLQDAINRLIALWNQNPLLVEGLLTLAKNTDESLALFGDILLPKDNETLTSVTENPKQIDNPVDSEKTILAELE